MRVAVWRQLWAWCVWHAARPSLIDWVEERYYSACLRAGAKKGGARR